MIKFESLNEKHLDLLYQFEMENRTWFESLIATRGDNFYSYQSVKEHISNCILSANAGKSYSGVLVDNGAIIARGNIKDIDSKNNTCTVGYRVAEKCTGKGYAGYCLGELISKANTLYKITDVEAKVLDNNPASIAVLKKQGFNMINHLPNFTVLNGKSIGCSSFKRSVALS